MAQVTAISADKSKTMPEAAPLSGVLRSVIWLALPIMAEQILSMAVGLTDTYLANHLGGDAAAPTAAVGTMAYIMWFIGLIVGSIGTGSTAIIARASGARHRSLANQVAGQSISGALIVGLIMAVVLWVSADGVVYIAGLAPDARGFARQYLRILSLSLPFSMIMFTANACLRGSGDMLRPAMVMVLVDITNVIASFGLTYGWWGMPKLGFAGIAIGTSISYTVGVVAALWMLKRGNKNVRLMLGRMRLHWLTIKRIVRIGLPTALEGLLSWSANFAVVIVINATDVTNVSAAAHINSIRIEGISFLLGMAFATAAATLVGQNLGRGDPRRAARSAWMAYVCGGGLMTALGLFFIFASHIPAELITDDPRIAALTAKCLAVTGTIQAAFAASIVFSGALRGAGDTLATMLLNLSSIIGVRFIGVLIVGWWLDMGLVAIWGVLCTELAVRGLLILMRFLHGGWKFAKV